MSDSMYYPGYQEDRKKVLQMDDNQLLSMIDSLYGRDNLKFGATHEDILQEALAQHKREWTDTSSKTYELVEFYTKLNKAMKNERR